MSRTFAGLSTIVVLAFLMRVVMMLALDAHVIESDWAFGYETGRIAESVATGEGFGSPFDVPTGPTAWLAPAYPALLGFLFRLLGTYSQASAVAILIFNSLVSALTCAAVFWLASLALDRSTAWLSAALLAVYPPSLWHAVNTIWDTSLLALAIVLLVCGLYTLGREISPKAPTLYGLALGLAAWINPVVFTLLPVAWLQIFRHRKQALARKLASAVLVTLVAFCTVAPWMIRNYRELGRPYLRSNLGLELKLGNSEAAWQDTRERRYSAPWFLGHPSVVPEELARFADVGEAVYVQQAMAEALDFIRYNPGKFALLSLRRVYLFWLSDLAVKNDWVGNLDLSLSLSWMRKACHLLPLPFLALGLVLAVRRKMDILPLAGAMMLFPLVYYATHVSERYRFPIEPLILVVASYGVLALIERLGLKVKASLPPLSIERHRTR